MFRFIANFFYYLFSFIVALFFILFGVISIILPWSPKLRTDLIEFILENSIALSLFGFGFLVIGLGFLISLYLSSKRQYYYLKTDDDSVLVDEAVIQQYLDSYWKQLFPEQTVYSRISIKKNKIKIAAELPNVSEEERKTLLERIQADIKEILKSVLGYNKECLISLSFPSQSKTNKK